MSETINSNGTLPAAVSGYIQHNIASSTNTSPIVVTWGVAPGFVEGDTINVEGHAVNTGANGLWVYHVVSPTTGSLVGSVGVGVGGATGFGVDYNISPLLTVPDDTDAADVSSINPAIEGLFDCVPYLYERVGAYRARNVLLASAVHTVDTAYSTTTPSAAAWASCSSMTGLLSGTNYAMGADIIDAAFSSSANVGGTPGTYDGLALAVSINGGAYVRLQDSQVAITQLAGPMPVQMRTRFNPGADNCTYNLAVQCIGQSGTANIVLYGSWTLCVTQYRSNT